MNTHCLKLIFLLLFTANLAFSQSPTSVFTNLDVFDLEWASDPQISPPGKHIVYVRNGMDIMNDRSVSSLWIMDPLGAHHQKLTSREVRESSPRWSPEGDRIAFISSTENGSEIYVYWMETGEFAKLSNLANSPGNMIWSPDGKRIAFTMLVQESPPQLVKPPKKPEGAIWADPPKVETRLKHEVDGSGYIEPGFDHIFVLPAEGGTPRQITSGDFHHDGFLQWTPDGQTILFSANRDPNWEYDYTDSEIYSIHINSGKITELTDRDGPDFHPVPSPDGSTVAYLGYEDRIQTYQTIKLHLMATDGSDKKVLSAGFDRSISDPVWSTDGNGLYFQYDEHGNTKIGYIDMGGEVRTIAGNLGGTSIGRPYGGGSFSISENGSIAYTYTTPYHPAEIAIRSYNAENVSVISSLNHDLLLDKKLGEVEEIWYKSSLDQRSIQGWIVKPPGFKPNQMYPLLVENHGGPVSNYGDRFSPEIQLYAANGYVVFYPNPRGSTSYGEEFGNLLYHNYPGDDYQDVMDGVDAVLGLGYVHEDSLFVTGGSAGGIMTAWIIGKNNRFRAAAVQKPVMNWVSKTLTADNYYGYSFYRYPDWPWENIEGYMKYSPISLVGNIQTPTLVLVGTADLRTPLSEAKQLYHALKLRKIETALVTIPGASHNIAARPSQLIAKVDHVLAWFEKYRKK